VVCIHIYIKYVNTNDALLQGIDSVGRGGGILYTKDFFDSDEKEKVRPELLSNVINRLGKSNKLGE
jgi:hypothetical protein